MIAIGSPNFGGRCINDFVRSSMEGSLSDIDETSLGATKSERIDFTDSDEVGASTSLRAIVVGD